MAIRELEIEGVDASHTYAFSSGVNLIVGGVGTGKTSMLQAIKYGLGGNALRSSAVRASVVAVAVLVEVNGRNLRFRRVAGDRMVEVVDVDSRVHVGQVHAAGPGTGQPTASDLLLEQLGIPRIALPRARSRPTNQVTTISFWDVFEYLYVRQVEMDSSIAQHTNPVRDPRRRATFEVLYGITDEQTATLERRIGALRTSIAEGRKWVTAIGAFIADQDSQPETVLRLKLEQLIVDLRNAEETLEALRGEARAESQSASGVRERLIGREAELDGARRGLASAEFELQKLESVNAQVSVSLDRLDRSEVAVTHISPFEFRQCPRCLQALTNRIVEDGTCPVCLQDDAVPDPDAAALERARLVTQGQETAELVDSVRAGVAELMSQLQAIESDIQSLNADLDAETAAFVSRRFSDVEQAGRRLAEIKSRRAAVMQTLQLHERLRTRSNQVHEDNANLTTAEAALIQARGELDLAAGRVQELSRLFDDLLEQFGYPWYDPNIRSRIDPDTYLPVTGDETFDEASAGMRTLLNVAYHMAGLRYGLQQQDSLLPTLLVLDSPRKNLGSLTDREIGARVYRRIRALDEAFVGQFQMIVADNDPPPLAQTFPTIELTYDRPFVPWLAHPGPTVEPIEQ